MLRQAVPAAAAACAAAIGYTVNKRSTASNGAARSEGEEREGGKQKQNTTSSTGFLGTTLKDERASRMPSPPPEHQHPEKQNQNNRQETKKVEEDSLFTNGFIFNAVDGQDPIITIILYTVGAVFVAWRVKNMLKNVSSAYRARGSNSSSSAGEGVAKKGDSINRTVLRSARSRDVASTAGSEKGSKKKQLRRTTKRKQNRK